jgi:hypothetical protein
MPWIPFQKAIRDPRVRKRLSEAKLMKNTGKQVTSTKTWARRAPGTGAAGAIQIDVSAGITSKFL